MEDKELLENAYIHIHTAMDLLKDVETFTDVEYEILNTIAEHINDLKIEKQVELEKGAEE